MSVVFTNIYLDFISKEVSLRYDCNYVLTDADVSNSDYYRFNELFNIVNCKVDVSDLAEFYYVEIGDVSKTEEVSPVFLSWDNRNELNENYFKKIEKGDIIQPQMGDILIAKVRPNLKKYIYIDEITCKYFYTSAFIVLRPKLIGKSLFYPLKTVFYKNLIAISRQGKGYPTIGEKDLMFLKFEKRIVDKLIKSNGEIEIQIFEKEKKIQMLKSKIKSEQDIINEVFRREFQFDIDEIDNIDKQKYISVSTKEIDYKNTNLRNSSKWHKLQLVENVIFKNIKHSEYLRNYLINEGTKNGWSPECSEFEDGAMVLGIDAINKDGVLTFDNPKYTNQTKKNINDFIIKENDFFISRGNTVDLVALASIAMNVGDDEYIYPDLMIRITFDTTKLNKEYLAYVFNSVIGRMYFKYAAKGKQQTMVKVSSEEIKQFLIPTPDIDEQIRIVSEIKLEIDKQNKVQAKLEKLRAEIDDIIDSAIAETKEEI
ncbi:MAG: hypothetical protein ACRC76_00415 [Proteocatella sp.]